MKIRWLDDTTGLNLKPTWEVENVVVHTLLNYKRIGEKGPGKHTTFLSIRCTPEQLRKLVEDYGEDIKMSLLGLEAIVLEPRKPLWVWNPPKGYEQSMKVGTYMAFEVFDEKENPNG